MSTVKLKISLYIRAVCSENYTVSLKVSLTLFINWNEDSVALKGDYTYHFLEEAYIIMIRKRDVYTYGDNVAPDQPVQPCNVIWELHSLLIGQWDPHFTD